MDVPSTPSLGEGQKLASLFLEEVCVESDRCSQCLDPASWSLGWLPCLLGGNQGRMAGSSQVLPLHLSHAFATLKVNSYSPVPYQNRTTPTKRLKANTLIQTSPMLVSVFCLHPAVFVYSRLLYSGYFFLCLSF